MPELVDTIQAGDGDETITFVSPETPIDMANCDREPIHIPGAIQPHGLLLVLNESGNQVLQVSSSARTFLKLDPAAASLAPLDAVIGSGAADTVRAMMREGSDRSFGAVKVQSNAMGSTAEFDVTVHRSGRVVLLELEPLEPSEALTIDQIRSTMRAALARVEHADSLDELAQGMAAEMRQVTGFDRVWVYRFHPDWHGEIIGESKRDDIETWMGMHYPASDLPAQARALFLKSWIRIIPDIDFVPSLLVPKLNPLDGQPLDLGCSVLRSVSPIHVRYLQNMGVTASLVISLIHRGTLWGLISGHHYSGPKRVSYGMRTLCEFLAQALSLQIGATDRLEDREYLLATRERQSALFGKLSADATVEAALTQHDVDMADLVSASGAILVRESSLTKVGKTPNDDQVTELLAWLRDASKDFYHTSALGDAFPPATSYATVASGLMAVPLARDGRDYLLWFRGEQRQTVKWAGDPRKSVTIAEDGSAQLHPRGSFALWEEEARGTALPWRTIELEAALDLRRAVLDILIRRAEETAHLNAELRLANAQLETSATELATQADALREQRVQREALLELERASRVEAERANRVKADFLAVMSHELRTPLNAIGGYAQLISLGIRGETSPEQRADLERIQINQRHLLGLINSILNFSRLEAGALQFTTTDVPLNTVLHGLDALIGPQMRAKSLRFSVNVCTPELVVRADEEKLRQIFLNLLTNAMKFTADGGEIDVSCASAGSTVLITIRDTGRGIESSRLASVFEPFVQIDRQITPEHEQGVGLGLAISRELARAMTGDLYADSTLGKGSTFTLRLPAAG